MRLLLPSPAIAVLLVFLTSCAASVPRIPTERLASGDIASMRAWWQQQLDTGDRRNRALFLNGIGECELLAGEVRAARDHMDEAGRIMGNWSTSGGEAFGAVVGSESSATWKGDPYEKVMNAVYTGLLYWFSGESDNARACFKKGILADAESEEVGAKTDCALLFWLAGRASVAMGLRDEAKDFFDEARAARIFAVRHGADGEAEGVALQEPMHGNLVCVLSMGFGPRKYAGGLHGSVAQYADGKSEARAAELFVDGTSVGVSTLMADVDYQAKTRGGRTIDGIREGKAVFKEVAGTAGAILINRGLFDSGKGQRDKLVTGLGLLALSMLTSTQADTRHWATLPETIHVLTAAVTPGEHDLRVAWLDAGGQPISRLDQTWLIDVPEDGEGIYHFRSLPAVGPSLSERSP